MTGTSSEERRDGLTPTRQHGATKAFGGEEREEVPPSSTWRLQKPPSPRARGRSPYLTGRDLRGRNDVVVHLRREEALGELAQHATSLLAPRLGLAAILRDGGLQPDQEGRVVTVGRPYLDRLRHERSAGGRRPRARALVLVRTVEVGLVVVDRLRLRHHRADLDRPHRLAAADVHLVAGANDLDVERRAPNEHGDQGLEVLRLRAVVHVHRRPG